MHKYYTIGLFSMYLLEKYRESAYPLLLELDSLNILDNFFLRFFLSFFVFSEILISDPDVYNNNQKVNVDSETLISRWETNVTLLNLRNFTTLKSTFYFIFEI